MQYLKRAVTQKDRCSISKVSI